MTTIEPTLLNRRRLLCTSAALAAWTATGCNRSEQPGGESEAVSTRTLVPLRVTLVGDPDDAEPITRGWESLTDHPLEIRTVLLDRSNPDDLAAGVVAEAERTDVMIVPLLLLAEVVQRELVVPLSGIEFETANEQTGEIVAAARNAAANYAGESYCIPLGAQQPFLLSGEEVPTLESWEAYDSLVEQWDGLAGEPTAPGWAGAMFLWRSAAERNWLLGREALEPLVGDPAYVRSLEQMVQTCTRYQATDQTPQQIWEGVATAKLRGGIGFPERRSGVDGVIVINQLPGITDASRVLLDPFSPVIMLAANCRQSAVAKQFMNWISGGDGSQPVRRQIRGMTDTRVNTEFGSESGVSLSAGYDLELLSRLSFPVTMPTLQLLAGGEYYGVLDRQVIRALRQEVSPSEALAEVAEQWQAITARVGVEDQLRVWRRAQGMRG